MIKKSTCGKSPVPLGLRLRLGALRFMVGILLFVIGSCLLPRFWARRDAGKWYDGKLELHRALGNGVAEWLLTDLSRNDFTTGSSQFNGEWLFGTYTMAAMGYGQTALAHPELREKHERLMDACIERLLSEEVRKFDREMWGDDPIDSLSKDSAHAAYLGYFNMVLGLHRLVDPDSKYADLNDSITGALRKRVEQSDISLIESYPSEYYPVDNCAVIGSIGLHGKASGVDHSEFLAEWVATCRMRYVDKESGLLYQCVLSDGRPVDEPRGSGTALGLYFLSFADMEFSEDLYDATSRSLARTIFGFGGVREYSGSAEPLEQCGDIDSGPVVCGLGLSPTGFLISGSRIHGDQIYYSKLVGTAYVCGAPFKKKDKFNFVVGGPLGDAIMFAMLTAGTGQ